MLLTPDDGVELYAFELAETTASPVINVHGEASDSLTGVAVYNSKKVDYIFAAQTDVIEVYEYPWTLIDTIALARLEDIEIQGISMHQAATEMYPQGVLAFAVEADDYQGFGLASLEGVLEDLGIDVNTKYNPSQQVGCHQHNPIKEECSQMGFFSKADGTCDCFFGTDGETCEKITCVDNCSGRGTCVGPNTCECEDGWGGLHCSFLLVEALYETEANGADGDDPAIWISPKSRELSRIITTTKTEQGAGLGVFDLSGKQLQVHYSEQPNNVDVIYGFKAGNRSVDLAYAACRGDNTLWLVT